VHWENVFEDAPTYTKLQPTCARGHTLVDFKCTPCFDAARTGAVRRAALLLIERLHLRTSDLNAETSVGFGLLRGVRRGQRRGRALQG
jgi:hypothetical protein